MKGSTTRRDFLRGSTALGSCLMLPGIIPGTEAPSPERIRLAAHAAVRGDEGSQGHGNGRYAPITVVRQSVSRDINPRAGLWGYITEILQHAGQFFQTLSPSELLSAADGADAIILLAGDLRLTAAEQEAIAKRVEGGASLIGIGGTSGLDRVFGVTATTPLAEGWIKVTAAEHPVTAGLRSSLHVFGGCVATAGSATSLAVLEWGVQRAAIGSAVLEHQFGAGRALLLAPDLIFSVAHMQQGIPVLQDGTPSPDGSARLDDGILKAEDGLVLDWLRDRSPMEPDGGPVFLEPISDELREMILRAIFHVARQQGVTLPMLWYWPHGLKAIGHISHDTDGNEPDKAEALLEVMNGCQVKSTWCVIYPGGYPREFYNRLKDQGFEIALHYDAHTGGERTSWSKDNFVLQHQWLLEEAGLPRIVSNKNHYTRWENRLDFLHWCEQVGIESDQTRGPSKKGTIGFPLGGSHPYFPLDDQLDPPQFVDVLEINMLTQDLVIVCPAEYGRQLLDSAARHHGIAHFLFHPAHILKPGVAEALGDLVQYGRANGLEWWTSERIQGWERSRRKVRARFESRDRLKPELTLHAEQPLHQATLLVLKARDSAPSVIVGGHEARSERWTVYGFEFEAVTMDLAGDLAVRVEQGSTPQKSSTTNSTNVHE